MTPEQIRENLIRRLAATYEADERAMAEANARLPALVGAIRDALGERRIVLFGSLATGLFRVASDVDLAVEGVGIEAPPELLKRLAELAGRRVEVVDPEVVGYAVQRAIARGRVLHEPER